MCTLVILRRPDSDWPLIVAGNRDEMRDRPWRAPARHWEDRPDVVAGLDERAGGSWLGVNDHGMVAAVMNREGALGPEAGRRTRGELVLEALDHGTAAEAATALAHLEPRTYRAFNLFVGDALGAHWVCHRDDGGRDGIKTREVDAGLHMLAARDLDDASDPRIRTYLPRFREAAAPDPEAGEWGAWQPLLASRVFPVEDGPYAAMNVERPDGFGTVCSHLVAIPRHPEWERPPVFLFAAGPPDRAHFDPIPIRRPA